MRRLWALLVVACAVCAWVAPALARESDAEERLVRRFTDSVRLRVREPATVREPAHQGGIFTPEVAGYISRVIRKAFRGSAGRNMRRTIRETEVVALPELHVNDVYPKHLPVTTMPPTLLRRLPRLPEEVVYRIVGRALVLHDATSYVILDFMPDAIPVDR